MKKNELRIQQVFSHLENNDLDLGFRLLMDCVHDTQDFSLFKETISLADWKAQNPNNETGLTQRCKTLLEKTAKIPIEEAPREDFIVEGEKLYKSYGANRFSLGPISVNIKKGEVYGLVGENGNGKTTLLRILAQELKLDGGEICYNFKEKHLSSFDLKTKLIYIPQRTKTWYGSLKDNLKFVLSNYNIPAEENEIRTLMMIARFGLWNYKHLKWSELSSGYKMRFELARTMLRQPELLLLDEPLANLDILSQQLILEDLKSICNSLNHPVGLILSSQQLYEVEKVSDKVIYLKNGKYHESHSEVKEEIVTRPEKLIVEIESTLSREVLTKAFEDLNPERLIYNGGVYIAFFPSTVRYHQVLLALGAAKVEIVYSRNISKSSRRFFVS
ncbi:MAG TPA: ATP-binding cassette domain-containing protein [Flavobacteriaceae bacterium]|nr:ABC transporter ATP-binding protein [Flavobacteriaceae bacterium]HPF11297.1 ATP-binding cassette domain-containing protein [Flavobacteriaceae bacterium]HQU22211.1 ATP-binding cassette domain-containing protein [Flavobacteriaceae bacterium]HQU64484.1 ATP-binding cassette domain-containing protein [Flavobacteriaceae bacterium]HRW44615.1 ATP-binding cassette domain-containing protein [Flavobacteriaceae bacterium]